MARRRVLAVVASGDAVSRRLGGGLLPRCWEQNRGRDWWRKAGESRGKGVKTSDAGRLHSRRRVLTGGAEVPLPTARLRERNTPRNTS